MTFLEHKSPYIFCIYSNVCKHKLFSIFFLLQKNCQLIMKSYFWPYQLFLTDRANFNQIQGKTPLDLMLNCIAVFIFFCKYSNLKIHGKHAFLAPNQCIFREKELHFTGIGIDGPQIRFRFPTLESSTRFLDSILDALVTSFVKMLV